MRHGLVPSGENPGIDTAASQSWDQGTTSDASSPEPNGTLRIRSTAALRVGRSPALQDTLANFWSDSLSTGPMKRLGPPINMFV
jgi:hypothetical protein